MKVAEKTFLPPHFFVSGRKDEIFYRYGQPGCDLKGKWMTSSDPPKAFQIMAKPSGAHFGAAERSPLILSSGLIWKNVS